MTRPYRHRPKKRQEPVIRAAYAAFVASGDIDQYRRKIGVSAKRAQYVFGLRIVAAMGCN